MRDTRLNRFAFRLGRVVGFALIPMTFLVVAYAAWVAARIVGGHY